MLTLLRILGLYFIGVKDRRLELRIRAEIFLGLIFYHFSFVWVCFSFRIFVNRGSENTSMFLPGGLCLWQTLSLAIRAVFSNNGILCPTKIITTGLCLRKCLSAVLHAQRHFSKAFNNSLQRGNGPVASFRRFTSAIETPMHPSRGLQGSVRHKGASKTFRGF